MNAFEYANPTSVEDAISLLADAWGETEVLAGGTDLVTSLKQGLTEPRLVVSLSKVNGLRGITKQGKKKPILPGGSSILIFILNAVMPTIE